MSEKVPKFIKGEEELDEYLEYLDELRESGITNMYGAGGIYSNIGVLS